MRTRTLALAAMMGAFLPRVAAADTFPSGSIIIPMDTTYQNTGMLKAYGLVYDLVRRGVPVTWVIRQGKAPGGADFVASATDRVTGAPITAHGYRGGPWIVDASHASVATPIIAAWQAANVTTVHVATVPFDGDVARRLIVAPSIAMFADGNQKVARKYMIAAGIPDSLLDPAWPDTSPDMLDPDEVSGPTTTNHADGKLFDGDADPVYCQFMSMHWGVNDARNQPEVVAEVRAFLNHPTHFFAECQAVNAYENDPVNGLFLTPRGFVIGTKPGTNVDLYNHDSPFAQFDGPFESVGGSEPSYSLPVGDSYKAGGITMITRAGTPEGFEDVWMTGFLDGACPPTSEICGSLGKVSYLGGHEYEVKLPITANPKTQGTRLFLNSLFEAQCATEAGQPSISVNKTAPASTAASTVTFTISYSNGGPGVALAVVLRDPLPAGTTFVSATGGGTFDGTRVNWNLGNLGVGESGSVSFTVTLSAFGTYLNQATLNYRVGLNGFVLPSNATSTTYDADTDGDGVVDSLDNCPGHFNPLQNLASDPTNCGACGNACSVPGGVAGCSGGTCFVSGCNLPLVDCDGLVTNGCEYDSTGFTSDPANCGGCGVVCSVPRATAGCTGVCTVGACNSGFSNCNGLVVDGCEYANAGFLTDPNHCGGCNSPCQAGVEVCQGGACVPTTCPAGTADCGGAPGDCETNVATDVNHCGGCNIACAPPNAAGACSGGSCGVGTCNPGFADCNGLPGDGCEYAVGGFQTDPNHCGGCGVRCAPANATGACVAGGCTVGNCAAGFADCNQAPADGCEVAVGDLATDVQNCGGCGNACSLPNAAEGCVGGLCTVASCALGFVDVDGDPSNGCEYPCTTIAGDDATCDGVDDDCDGVPDEDHVRPVCGVGACRAQGACVGGVEACSPLPAGPEGPGGDFTCSDGADNDCDGDTDLVDSDCPSGFDAGAGDGAAGAAAGGAAGVAGTSAAGSSGSAGSAGTSAGAAGAAADAAAGAGGNTAAGAGGDGATAGSSAAGASAVGGSGATVDGSAAGTGGSATGGSGAAPAGGAGGVGGGVGTSPDGGLAGTGASGDSSGDTGGCGCRVPIRSPDSAPWMLLLAAAAAARRRRTSRDD